MITIQQEPTFFFSSSKEKIAATLYKPSFLGSQKLAAVVLCQGLSGEQKFVLPEIAKRFAENGFIALTFDYRGFGESEGKKGLIDPMARVQDAQDAASFLRAQPHVDIRRVGIYGHSFGGAIAQKTAITDPTLAACVSTSGFCSGKKLLRGLRTTSEWIAFKEILEEDRIEITLSGKSRLVDMS